MSVDLRDLAHSFPRIAEERVGLVPRQPLGKEVLPDTLERFGALAVRLFPNTRRVVFEPWLVGLVGVELPRLLYDVYPSHPSSQPELTGRWGEVDSNVAIWADREQQVLDSQGPKATRRACFMGNVLLINANKTFDAQLKVANLANRAVVLSGSSLDAIAALLPIRIEEAEYQAFMAYAPQQAVGRVSGAYIGTTLHQ